MFWFIPWIHGVRKPFGLRSKSFNMWTVLYAVCQIKETTILWKLYLLLLIDRVGDLPWGLRQIGWNTQKEPAQSWSLLLHVESSRILGDNWSSGVALDPDEENKLRVLSFRMYERFRPTKDKSKDGSKHLYIPGLGLFKEQTKGVCLCIVKFDWKTEIATRLWIKLPPNIKSFAKASENKIRNKETVQATHQILLLRTQTPINQRTQTF